MTLKSSLVAQLVTKIKDKNNKVTYIKGTAYPIRENIILTARHVIPNLSSCEKTCIEWRDDDSKTIVEKYALEEIIYESEKYDLLLARCKTPEKMTNVSLPSMNPERKASWDSLGYPCSGKDNNKKYRFKDPSKGSFYIDKDDDFIQQLEVKGDTSEVKLWRGMSGAPVFLAGKNELVAIIIETPRQDKAGNPVHKNRLYATSIPYVLKHDKEFRQAIEVNKEQDDSIELHKKLISQIEKILATGGIPLDKLKTALKLDPTASNIDIARYLVKDLSAHDAIEELSVLSEDIEEQCRLQAEDWKKYLFDIEQLCGWLLINSVDKDWWLEHGQGLLKENNNLATSVPLASPNYIEVIISRGLLQSASYSLDEQHNAVPKSKKHKALLLFDATSDEASDIQILSYIFKDIRRGGTPKQDVNFLLKEIKKTVKNIHKGRKKKVIYYLVSKEYLTLLQSRTWYKQAEQDMSGYLQFICCDVSDDKEALSPCGDDQSDLLETLAAIMRLRNERD